MRLPGFWNLDLAFSKTIVITWRAPAGAGFVQRLQLDEFFSGQHDDHESEFRPVHQHERRARHAAQHEVDVVTPIGVIGLGLMGSALAERLLGAGHRVMGWDIDPGRIAALRERGGEVERCAAGIFRLSPCY